MLYDAVTVMYHDATAMSHTAQSIAHLVARTAPGSMYISCIKQQAIGKIDACLDVSKTLCQNTTQYFSMLDNSQTGGSYRRSLSKQLLSSAILRPNR